VRGLVEVGLESLVSTHELSIVAGVGTVKDSPASSRRDDLLPGSPPLVVGVPTRFFVGRCDVKMLETPSVSSVHPAPDDQYPVAGRDLSALIGIVASLEAELSLSELPEHLERHLAQRLLADGLLPDSATSPSALRVTLANLSQRLHAAYGGYPDGPPQLPLP
jgi:hypothetical protein